MRATSDRWVAITAGSLAVVLGALDTYVVVTIMTDMMKEPPDGVGIPLNKIQQVTPVVTWYLLGYIAAMPLLGRASDRFGRKLVLQVSLAAFAIGSVVTALSGSFPDLNQLIEPLNQLIIGRAIQGTASGALLPVTLALAADLWSARNRAGVLGGVGAAQELGSVLGPLYGVGVVWLLHTWRDVFWINVPLTVVAMLLIHISLPKHSESESPQRIDVTGGVLLAASLGLATWGLYNPNPDGKQVLPENGPPLLIAAVIAAVAFFVWEKMARTRLIDPQGVRFRPFLAGLGSSLCAGAALMVTLVNVELFSRGVLGLDQNTAVGKLVWFLGALPVGALIGGWIAIRIGDRIVAVAGLVIAGFAYWLVSHWHMDVLTASHSLVAMKLPVLPTDLIIAGFGLGLVIGPLTSATLRVVPTAQHGIASAAVVVSRMIGMLIGMAALSAWGLYKFNQNLAAMPTHKPTSLADAAAQLERNVRTAYAMQYASIFQITAIICIVGAVLGLLIAGRKEHAEEPDTATEADPVPVT
ncbi:MFS transporter [Mycobacterium sp. OTB74]|uniref:MFS transporter n=1 Tax=Mycobacterium sp. OTB74 TaxID=1853452 RepID=UPI002474C6B5|nr:MFS transporter [Mycobacterium sp. OTB74]MDH6244239.1 MFS family permease [Mycobacterium sp. OTB74]